MFIPAIDLAKRGGLFESAPTLEMDGDAHLYAMRKSRRARDGDLILQ